MKIAIVTITDMNLGNRLQNYAVQQILKSYNLEVETLIKPQNYRNIKLKDRIKNTFIDKISLFSNFFIKNIKLKRRYNFINFNKKIKFSNIKIVGKINKKKLCKLDSKYDFFAVGSDQIWNPNFYDDNLEIEMLDFTCNIKKIAISPSIACDNLTNSQIIEFKKRLAEFDCLSCREEQGAKLIEKITGKTCISLIDPTLMISSKDWDKILKKPKCYKIKSKYILIYFLGILSEEYIKEINRFSKAHNLKIININDKNSVFYEVGPSEFIYLIKYSSIIMTDSFHGAVFSYIYNKPMKIFKRQGFGGSMNSRLTNLINKLHLKENILFNNNIEDDILEMKYNKKDLEFEQKKFKKYLDDFFSNKLK